MWPGSLLVTALTCNYLAHRRGLQTICQWVREHVPPEVAAAAVDAGYAWLRPHLLDGYPKET